MSSRNEDFAIGVLSIGTAAAIILGSFLLIRHFEAECRMSKCPDGLTARLIRSQCICVVVPTKE